MLLTRFPLGVSQSEWLAPLYLMQNLFLKSNKQRIRYKIKFLMNTLKWFSDFSKLIIPLSCNNLFGNANYSFEITGDKIIQCGKHTLLRVDPFFWIFSWMLIISDGWQLITSSAKILE